MPNLKPLYAKYARKAQVALAAAVPVVIVALSDGNVDGGEVVQIVSVVLGAFGVFVVRNAAGQVSGVTVQATHEPETNPTLPYGDTDV